MPSDRVLIPAAVVAGVVLIIIAAIYWIEPAKSLPFPDFLGHEAGVTTHHIKHGIAAFFVGVALLVYAWFQTGGDRKQGSTPS